MSTENNSTIKEQSLHPEQSANRQGVVEPSPAGAEAYADLDERVRRVLLAAAEKKAIDPVVLDLRSIASFTNYFLITSGANVRQVQAIADAMVDELKSSGERAARVEGYNAAEWILVDFGDFIVHVFEDKARKFYDLERLWRESARIQLPPEVAGAGSSLRKE
jgi:ribosome-associated protein